MDSSFDAANLTWHGGAWCTWCILITMIMWCSYLTSVYFDTASIIAENDVRNSGAMRNITWCFTYRHIDRVQLMFDKEPLWFPSSDRSWWKKAHLCQCSHWQITLWSRRTYLNVSRPNDLWKSWQSPHRLSAQPYASCKIGSHVQTPLIRLSHRLGK